MLSISPYSEPAPLDTAQISALESSKNQGPGRDEAPEAGEFANILAGLLGETGGEKALPEDGTTEGVSLAENNELLIEPEPTGEETAALTLNKNLKFGKNQLKTGNNPEAEALNSADPSPLNQNIFVSAESIVKQRENPGGEAIEETRVETGDLPKTAAQLPAEPEQPQIAELAARAGSVQKIAEAGQMNPQLRQKNVSLDDESSAGEDAAVLTGAETAVETSGEQTFENRIAGGFSAESREENAGLSKNADGKKSRLEELRGRERRGDRLSVEVQDLRSGPEKPEADPRFNAALERTAGDAGNGEVTLELRLGEAGQNPPALETGWETKAGQAFENLLARELHENFNNDIVRHASMILRDEGRGTIRLALRPESLGNVKISLEMAENKITGHIVVESEEALRAFEREIHSLEQAFKDSGFEGANLEMSLAQDGRGSEQFQQEKQTRALLSEFVAASRYETREWAETPLVEIAGLYRKGQAAINMLA